MMKDETGKQRVKMKAGKKITRKKLTETFMLSERLIVEGNVISDVTILGEKSLNGPTYTERYMESSVGLYEGSVVNANHRVGKNIRSIEDRLGLLEGVYHDKTAKKLKAEKFVLNPKHRLAEQILWAAENQPATMGFSHDVIAGGTKNEDGEFLAESCHKVLCVDLVADPGTTKSLFESIQDKRELSDNTMDLCNVVREGIADLRSVMLTIDSDKESEKQLTPMQQRDNIVAVVEGLKFELDQLQPIIDSPSGETQGEIEMKIDDLSLSSLKESNEEVYNRIIKEASEELNSKSQQEENSSLKAQLKEAQQQLFDLENEKKAKQLCEKKGLSEAHVTPLFLSQLVVCKEESEMLALIEDRLCVAGGSTTTSSRRDVVGLESTNIELNEQKSVADLSVDEFVSQLKF